MKKSLIKTLAVATLALTLVFTVATTTGDANDGISTYGDIPGNHVIIR